MINGTEHFATDFQELKASTAERIDKTERLIWENVMEHDTTQKEDMKKQVELLQNENNRLRMESESLLKVIELLSVQKKLLVKLTTTQKNEQYEEPTEQRKARIVPGRRTYSEATKSGKKIFLIGDSHLNRTKMNIFQKLVNGGKTYFNVFRGATTKKFNHYILPTLHENQPDVVLLHVVSNDMNNQTKGKINTEQLTGILSTLVNLASILM